MKAIKAWLVWCECSAVPVAVEWSREDALESAEVWEDSGDVEIVPVEIREVPKKTRKAGKRR
jgi:hypothetical protein